MRLWFGLALCLLPLLAQAATVDLVLVEKNRHRLSLYAGDKLVSSYQVAPGKTPIGAKTCEGDDKTPEGEYRITDRIENSAFHRALHLSYPNAADTARARSLGCQPGGRIMIHGLRNGLGWLGALHRQRDWTAGCIALTNAEIEQVWQQVADGTRVVIRP